MATITAPGGNALRVEGLGKLARDLKKAPGELDKDLKRANKEAAGRVQRLGQIKYRRVFRQRRGFSRRGITSRSTARRAQVSLGGKRRPYLLGQEFGSTGRYPQFVGPFNPRGRSVRTGKFGRGRSRGRFFFPAIGETRTLLEEEYLDLVEKQLQGRTRSPI